jgi:hypothetical protein
MYQEMQTLLCELVCRTCVEIHIDRLKQWTLDRLKSDAICMEDHYSDIVNHICDGVEYKQLKKVRGTPSGVHVYSRTILASGTKDVLSLCCASKRTYDLMRPMLTRMKKVYAQMRWSSLRSNIVFSPKESDVAWECLNTCDIIIIYCPSTCRYRYMKSLYNAAKHSCCYSARYCTVTHTYHALLSSNEYLRAVGEGKYMYNATYGDDLLLEFYVGSICHASIRSLVNCVHGSCEYVGDDLLIRCGCLSH